MESKSIERSFIETLRKSDLSSVAAEVSELAVDRLLDDGLLRDIPVVSTFRSLWKAGATIRDWLFIKKLLKFLVELQELDAEVRNAMVTRLEAEPVFSQKVGESLLLLLDRLDHMEKPSLLGRAFRAYCKGQVDVMQLQVINRVIDRAFVPHLSQLSGFLEHGAPAEVLQTFLDCGLAWVPPNYASTTIRPTPIAAPFLRYILLVE
jgi:hypothetical protein